MAKHSPSDDHHEAGPDREPSASASVGGLSTVADRSNASGAEQTEVVKREVPAAEPSHVVGIGASAGGLEALEALLKAMPTDTGMAFVVLQHLSPDFKSVMDELLSRHTKMRIERVEGPTPIRRDTVYLLTPRKEMVMADQMLDIRDRPSEGQLWLPINVFFRSLAREAKERAIAIVLSGTGTDGSDGLRDVHAAGGLILAQNADTAKFDGMPRAAIATGLVKAALPAEEMPKALLAYARDANASLDRFAGKRESEKGVPGVLNQLRDRFGIDFHEYKVSTVSRRIDRRIQATKCESILEYEAYVQDQPEELELLYRDMLIHVTRFFRDAEAFEKLRAEVVERLVAEHSADSEIRIWVPGCATGQEPYTLAMLFSEALRDGERLGRQVPSVRIFATDVHSDSLQIASDGVYDPETLEDVPAELVERYFVKEHDRYKVIPILRKMLIFSQHNLIRDPPFTRIDLVSCRHLLIYLEPSAQARAVATLHYALNLHGALLLGPSEGLGDLASEFETVDRQWKLYRKLRDIRLPLHVRMAPPSPPVARQAIRSTNGDPRLARAYDELLSRYVPSGLMINEQREVVHVFGDAGAFLRTPAGRITTDVAEMVRGDLRIAVSSAVQNALKNDHKVTYRGVRIELENGGEKTIDLIVDPFRDRYTKNVFLFLLFTEIPADPPPAPVDRQDRDFVQGEVSSTRIKQLEDELAHSKESLQTTVEELETSNEELQSTNEEMLAANEELQSTNEELHSVNEELYSVNAEHEQKIKQLVEATNDLNNLMRSTDIGTIFLDRHHRIRLFTPRAVEIFNLMPQDIDRDIRHITFRFKDDDIIATIEEVTRTGKMRERKINAGHNKHYLERVMPYLDENGTLAGIVITFVDISALMKTERQLRLAEFSVSQSSIATYWSDPEGCILRVNEAMCEMLGYSKRELVKLCVSDLSPEIPPERWETHWEDLRQCKQSNIETILRHRDGHEIPVQADLHWLEFEGNEYQFVFVRDISDRITIQRRLERSEQLFRSTFELATVGLLHLDTSGQLLKVNQKICIMLGYNSDELIGKNVLDLTHEKDHALEQEFLNNSSRGVIEPYELEKRFIRKDGRVIWVHVHGTYIDDPISGPYLLRVVNDITQRKQAQLALRESEERFRLLVEGGPQGVAMVDVDGIITLVNSQMQKLFDTPRDQFIGLPIEAILPTRFHDRGIFDVQVTDKQKSVPAGDDPEEPLHFEPESRPQLYGLRSDGTEIPIDIGLSPLNVGKRSFTLVTFSDVSDRVRNEQRVHDSLREKETLLQEIHHRVKNNLQMISSLLRLQADRIDSDELQAYFRESEIRVRSMALIHEKLYENQSLAQINFSDYVESLVAILRNAYISHGDGVDIRLELDEVHIEVDIAIPLGLILNELFANSLKHAFPDGRSGMVEVIVESVANRAGGTPVPPRDQSPVGGQPESSVETDHAAVQVDQGSASSGSLPDKTEAREAKLHMTIRDNGIGMSADRDHVQQSLGLRLVEILTKQIGGTMSRSTPAGGGVEYHLTLDPITSRASPPRRDSHHERS